MASRMNKLLTNMSVNLTPEEEQYIRNTLAPILISSSAFNMWRPSFNEDTANDSYYISWDLNPSTTRPPNSDNLRGPVGPAGADGASAHEVQFSADQAAGSETQYHLFWKHDVDESWTDLGYFRGDRGPAGRTGETGPEGPQGPSGDPGISDITFEAVQEAGHENGGTKVTFLFGPDGTQSSAFNIWNGNNGGQAGALDIEGMHGIVATKTGSTYQVSFSGAGGDKNALYGWNAYTKTWAEIPDATVNLLEGTGIQITENGSNYTIGVSADYALKSELPDVTDMATETWVGQQGFLTNNDLTDYATKTYANVASANAYNEAVAQIPNVTNFITKDVGDLTYYYKKTETSAASALSTEFAKYVNKPNSSLVNKYLVLRTTSAGAVDGWYDFQDQSYSKSEADGRYIQQAFTDNTLSGTGANAGNKLGVNTNEIPTKDWLDDNYLPLSGGTVFGSTTFSGSDFDHTLEIKRSGQASNYAHIGLNNSRGLSFKAFDDAQSHTLQLDLFPNQSTSNLIQLQHNGTSVGNLIPAKIHTGSYTPSADDGILHIILES